jgi:hypothetical protein
MKQKDSIKVNKNLYNLSLIVINKIKSEKMKEDIKFELENNKVKILTYLHSIIAHF